MSLFITTLYFPLGMGQFLASTLSTRTQILHLFSNFTWVSDDLTVEQSEIVSHWVTESCSIFVNLSLYMLVTVSVFAVIRQSFCGYYKTTIFCCLFFVFLVLYHHLGFHVARSLRYRDSHFQNGSGFWSNDW